MKNYKFIEKRYIDDISSDVSIYEHIKTKAKICTILNDDDNKVFSIAFRTPPINDCGLTHILEHSVLCGSNKYPVKDPFVELIKGSLNTFINAFTFPDKTMYPVASKNLKDFNNLIDVYMDAVFYPNIYKKEEIFKQEGWHYHLENINDDITYNGVVYNEMKGAFSDPTQILGRNIINNLYPDNQYRFESGGDPKYIPDLSYEDFKNFHKKYYSASNSYIFLYGNLNMEEELEYLDEAYLSKMDYVEFDTRIIPSKGFKKPIYKEGYYEVNDDLENQTFLSYNVSLPTTLDDKLMIAVKILINALFDVVGAPLKEALVKANICMDVQTSFDDGLLQPTLSIIGVGGNKEDEEKFINIIDKELKEIIKNGLDKKTILSIINNYEFKEREKSFSASFPKGLDIIINSMSSWLYDDNNYYGKLDVIKYYKELKEGLENNYFEKIIEEYILNNNHKLYFKLIPSHDCNKLNDKELKDKLKKYKDSLSKDELLKLVDDTKKLIEYQQSETREEDLNKLPKLKISDIEKEPEWFNLDVKDKNGYKILFSNYPTNKILYLQLVFDISKINDEDLAYASLYSDLFRDLPTKSHSYYELNQLIRNDLGSLTFNVQPYKTINNEAKISIGISTSLLIENLDFSLNIISEILDETIYDEKRIKEKLDELYLNIKQSFVGSGHRVAYQRSLSYIDEYSHNLEITSGISYYKFIEDLDSNFDDKKDYIVNKLKNVVNLLSKSTLMIRITGDEDIYNNTIDKVIKYADRFPLNSEYKKNEFKPKPTREAIKTPFNVNYVSRTGLYNNKLYNGSINVLENILSMGYLWEQVRVLGGAYGAMLRVSQTNTIGFSSYRDPNIDRTMKVYEDVLDFISKIDLTDDELLKYKIGSIGSKQTVLHNRDKALAAFSNYMAGITYDYKKKQREELLNANVNDLMKFKEAFKESLSYNNYVVLGNSDSIDKSKLEFDNIIEL